MNLYKQIFAFLPSKLGSSEQHNSRVTRARIVLLFINDGSNYARGFYHDAIRRMKWQIQISSHLHPDEVPFPRARNSRVKKMKMRDIVCKVALKSREYSICPT
jgi:hypothetical protein